MAGKHTTLADLRRRVAAFVGARDRQSADGSGSPQRIVAGCDPAWGP